MIQNFRTWHAVKRNGEWWFLFDDGTELKATQEEVDRHKWESGHRNPVKEKVQP